MKRTIKGPKETEKNYKKVSPGFTLGKGSKRGLKLKLVKRVEIYIGCTFNIGFYECHRNETVVSHHNDRAEVQFFDLYRRGKGQ